MNERDRRSHPRFPLVLAVEYPDTAAGIRDQTENLSAGGIFIRTERHFAVGDRVNLLVSVPHVPDPVELVVEVKRVRPADGSQPGGVAVWIPPDREEDRRTLERLTRAAAVAAESRQGGYRVLLVEDNALVAAMYTSALRRLSTAERFPGISVEVARDGHEAFARLLATPPVDLVVTDIYMPVMSGFALVEKIRAEERLRALPIVVISSGASEERDRLARLGVNLLLQKPVKYQDIVAAVQGLLGTGPQPGPPALLPSEPPQPEAAGDQEGPPGGRPLDTSGGKAHRSE
ncbi:MAG TPA: response regulator [Anaeromyxobacteraceae bacterium]|nr:response regulator [Anaeromyxobacteraceae bacterium]